MQFPESWLREFCNPPINTQQLADTLTMAGLEVEEMRSVAPAFSKVVVGCIIMLNITPTQTACVCVKWMWGRLNRFPSFVVRRMPVWESKSHVHWWVRSCQQVRMANLL
jgi:hypothetical protein